MASVRDPYLDFLRALAILLVLVHHVVQEWPTPQPWLIPYSSQGAMGVDLFFVLSGWLIGGLYWREAQKSGHVTLWRFWSRRWIRTIPPYLAALTLAWAAVAIHRSEPFDLGYLIFIQNYYDKVPFFLISWSLCVEEHFYLVVPLVFFLVGSLVAGASGLALGLLTAVPALSRAFAFSSFEPGFGYYVTASHFNADGLLLGFGVAYSVYFKRLRITHRLRLFFLLLGAVSFAALWMELPPFAQHVLDKLFIAIGFTSVLILGLGTEWSRWTGVSPIRWLAIASYSIYLTHALAIHAVVKGVGGRLRDLTLPFLFIEISAILLVGGIFHLLVERSSLTLRERLVPV